MRGKKITTVCVMVFLAATFLAFPFVWAREEQKAKENEMYGDSVDIDWQELYPPYDEAKDVGPAGEEESGDKNLRQVAAKESGDDRPGRTDEDAGQVAKEEHDDENAGQVAAEESVDDLAGRTDEDAGQYAKVKSVLSSIADLYMRVHDAITVRLDNRLPELTFYRRAAIEGYGTLNKLLGIRIVKDANDTTIRLDNGYLTGLYEKADTKTAADNLSEFSEWVRGRGADFLYVMCPSKKPGDADVIPGIIENTVDADKDRIAKVVSSRGVDLLDLREYMPEDYDEYMSRFYKTDHHWKVSTGLWAASVIAGKLNSEYGYDFDTDKFDTARYDTLNYPDLFLGTEGKKVSESYIGSEDFELLVPKYPVDIHIEVPTIGLSEDGDFMSMINEAYLERGDKYSLSPYSAMAYGEEPVIRITNPIAECSKKVLLIKDSFADCVVPYIASNCLETDVVDLRSFDGSVKTLISENDYDAVIVLTRSPGMSVDETADLVWKFK